MTRHQSHPTIDRSRARGRRTAAGPGRSSRRWSLVVAALVAMAGILSSCGSSPEGATPPSTVGPSLPAATGAEEVAGPPAPPSSATGAAGIVMPTERPVPAGAQAAAEVPASPPARVLMPSIGVDSALEGLGLRDDGTIATPTKWATAGWFAEGIQPGQPGPAVIAGHVDSTNGPAVFFRLDQLRPGDPVLVDRADGTQLRFVVTGSARFAKDEFRSDLVYGPSTAPGLRLVTCGGAFDRATRHYEDNLVVFAELDTSPA